MTEEIARRTAFADEHWRKYLREQPVLISGEDAHALSYSFGVLVGQDFARTVYATHATSETSRALMRAIDSGGRGQIINALADHESAIVAYGRNMGLQDAAELKDAAVRAAKDAVKSLERAGRVLADITTFDARSRLLIMDARAMIATAIARARQTIQAIETGAIHNDQS